MKSMGLGIVKTSWVMIILPPYSSSIILGYLIYRKTFTHSIFKFSSEVRTVIYTTNAIESLNATYRKLNRQRSVFPSDQALLKTLYLSTFEATKK